MFKFLFIAACVFWFISRGRLWRHFFNLRREIRAAVRRRSFVQYYVAVRWRELAGLAGFILAALAAAEEHALSYVHLHRWIAVLQYVLYACIALYLLFLIIDSIRLRRRFAKLLRGGSYKQRRNHRPIRHVHSASRR